MLNPSFSNRIDKLYQICEKYSVLQLYVFGSVLRDRFNSESDLDFFIFMQGFQ